MSRTALSASPARSCDIRSSDDVASTSSSPASPSQLSGSVSSPWGKARIVVSPWRAGADSVLAAGTPSLATKLRPAQAASSVAYSGFAACCRAAAAIAEVSCSRYCGSVIGTRMVPCAAARAAMVSSRPAGTAHELNRRRSVRRFAMAAARAMSSAVAAQGKHSTAARWSGCVGLGNRCTVVAHPTAANATRAWCNAAPQLTNRSRLSGSVMGSSRSGSANKCTELSPVTHRHGCELWIDGARSASAITERTVSSSGTAYRIMVTCPFVSGGQRG